MTPVQETPQIFTLLLVVCVLASLIIWLLVAYRLIRGRRASAFTLLSRWSIGVVVYIALSVVVAFARPARLIEQGQDWCFDDWCIAVEAVHHAVSPNGEDVTVTTDIRISNAGRSPEGVRGFWAFLLDDKGQRYGPTPGRWQEIVSSRVPGHGVARTSIDFTVSKGAHLVGFVTNHGGGNGRAGVLLSLLEIGQGGWLFHKQNMIRVE
jgi:hypothetical protein